RTLFRARRPATPPQRATDSNALGAGVRAGRARPASPAAREEPAREECESAHDGGSLPRVFPHVIVRARNSGDSASAQRFPRAIKARACRVDPLFQLLAQAGGV